MNKKLNDNQMLILRQLLQCMSDTQKDEIENEFFNNDLSITTNSNTNYKFDKNDITIIECPYCHSKNIIKRGYYKEKRKYHCKDCNKNFRDTYDTILFNLRKDNSVIIEYIKCMIDKRPLRDITEICNISLPTAHKWRHNILDSLSKKLDNIKLDGIVESDETYTRVSYKGNHTKSKNFIMPRPAHRSGGEVHTRGLSKEQVCISCFISDKNLSYSKVANLGQPSWNKIYNVIKNHIDKKSILVTDNYKGYTLIVDKLKINHIPMPKGEFSNGTFNIEKINSYHSGFKRLINAYFKGVSTKYLNNYIVYYNFIEMPKNSRNNKIVDLQDYVFKTKCKDLLKGSNRPAIPA